MLMIIVTIMIILAYMIMITRIKIDDYDDILANYDKVHL